MGTCTRRLALACALVLLAAAGPSSALAQQKVALLVGINEYKSDNLPALSYAEADVRDLAAVLKDAGYKVTLLTGSARDADFKATKAVIERRIKEVVSANTLSKDDTVVLAFSGHGIQFEKKGDEPDDAFFCPVDAQPSRDDRGTLVSLAMVYDQMSKCFAGTKLLLVDACRSDPGAVKGSKGGITSSSLSPPDGVAALFSCGAGERAWESDKLGHSVFYYYVLQGLRGDAQSPNGEVSFLELARQVMKRVPQEVAKLASSKQSPKLKTGELSIDPVLLVRTDASKPPPPPVEKAARTFKNTIGIEFVRIEAGTFRMGSPPDEEDRDPDETPHTVDITKAFYVGKYPVTVGQFRAFVEATGYKTEAEADGDGGFGYTGTGPFPFDQDTRFSWRDPGFDQDDSHPVVNVSWKDAQAFCRWLRQKEQKTYRLPTEAEWEYCCRAGTTTRFSSGDDVGSLAKAANIADRSFRKKCKKAQAENWDDGYAFTAPVDEPRFRGNAFGLYGMHGNVWQWCSDWYAEKYYKNSPRRDPQGPATGDVRVMRGGSYMVTSAYCRCAARAQPRPEQKCLCDLGFRVICEIEPGNR